jgi:hypothetical protein
MIKRSRFILDNFIINFRRFFLGFNFCHFDSLEFIKFFLQIPEKKNQEETLVRKFCSLKTIYDYYFLLKNMYQCRICLDEEDTDHNFIVPCKCKGSQKYIHRHCLDQWRSQIPNGQGSFGIGARPIPESDNFRRCNTCLFEYVIDLVPQNPKEEQRRLEEYSRLVNRDIFIVVVIIVLVIGILAMICYVIDDGFIRKRLNRWIPFDNEIIFYILTSLCVVFLTIAIIVLVLFNVSPYGMNNYAVLGVLMGGIISVYFVYMYVKKKMDTHKAKIWLHQEAKIQKVRCFKGREKELESLPIHR